MFFPVGVVLSTSAIWEKFPKFGTDFQVGTAQDISRVSGGMP
jgi:hypothetical protein